MDESSPRFRALDLNLLAVFDALLRSHSVSRTALELGRSQSAISHALARLREHYRDDLFLRGSEGMIPTVLAREQAPAVREFMRSATAATTPARAFKSSDLGGVVHLALSDTAALVVLPGLIPAIEAAAPAVRLAVRGLAGEALESALAGGETDLAVSGPLQASANILQRTLMLDRMAIIVADDCACPDPAGAADIAELREIAIEQPASHRYRLDTLRRTLGLPPPPVSSSHALLAPHLVARDPRTMAFLPMAAARIVCAGLPLRVLGTRFALPDLELVQYFHRRSKLDPMSQWLRELVAKAVLIAASPPA